MPPERADGRRDDPPAPCARDPVACAGARCSGSIRCGAARRRGGDASAGRAFSATRSGLPAARAVRSAFAEAGDDPIVAAVVKELGQFPPGTYVKLAKGELAVVVARGETASRPVVKALINKQGEALPEPIRRDCANAENAIVNTLPANQVRVCVDPKKPYC